MSQWRPPQHIRVKVIAIARHKGKLLVCEVLGDDGGLKGWCPLGGGVKFGESAAVALKREVREELACDPIITGPPNFCENIYLHHGDTGHEFVVAFPVRFDNPAIYTRTRFQIRESRGTTHWVEWIDVERFRHDRDALYPAALVAHMIE